MSPYKVTLLINNKHLCMEIDTGAAVSLVSETTYKTPFPGVSLSKPIIPTPHLHSRTHCCPGTAAGACQVQGSHDLTVVQGNGPSLLGRDWLSRIRLDWAEIGAVRAHEGEKAVSHILDKYRDVFTGGPGKMKHIKAHLMLREGARPRAHRPRQVPFAYRGLVGKELDRLEKLGVLRRVNHSMWASPIVPVHKKDGTIRVCGDYKVTINPDLLVDQYPLPKPTDLMACLTGGVCFTKLDLTSAYQQMELDEESRELVTITTQQGLYQYTRLPLRSSVSPGHISEGNGRNPARTT